MKNLIIPEKRRWAGWMFFLVLDFPISILVMATSGPGVVGLPWFIDEKYHFWSDVLWPGLVFQVIGTINWVLIVMLYRRIVGSSARLEDNDNHPSP